MKKIREIIKFILSLLIIILLIQFIIYLFTKNKTKTYQIKEKITFDVLENYNKENNYYIEISYKDYKFSFINDTNYYKKMHIIEDIKYLKTKDMFCIYPIFKKNKQSEMICNKDKKYYSYQSLKEGKKVKEFVKGLENDGYSFLNYNSSNKTKEYNHMKIYYNNQIKNSKIIVWNYTGIDIIGNTYNTFKLSDKDIYNNKLGIFNDKYYITPSYENAFEFNKMIEINIEKEKQKTYEFDQEVSFDSYINGIEENKLYIMDKKNLLQYTYNFNKHNLEEVGNKENNGIYYKNGKQENINIYDLKKEELAFIEEIKLDVLEDEYNIKEIYKYLNRYYFLTDENDVYMVYEENIKNPILLFKNEEILECKVVKDSLYFISKDSIYFYNRYYGLKKIITKNEFIYNYKNIFAVYMKD